MRDLDQPRQTIELLAQRGALTFPLAQRVHEAHKLAPGGNRGRKASRLLVEDVHLPSKIDAPRLDRVGMRTQPSDGIYQSPFDDVRTQHIFPQLRHDRLVRFGHRQLQAVRTNSTPFVMKAGAHVVPLALSPAGGAVSHQARPAAHSAEPKPCQEVPALHPERGPTEQLAASGPEVDSRRGGDVPVRSIPQLV